MPRQALFVTARYRSLGETYTLARFADALRGSGWNVDFLAFPFAVDFLRPLQFPVAALGEDLHENGRIVQHVVAARPPDVIFTADYFLLCFREVATVWSSRWLFEAGCPVATFDHLMFHPHPRRISMALHERLESLPDEALAAILRSHAPAGATLTRRRPRRIGHSPDAEIAPLPEAVAGIVRSCPVHDPRPEADPRTFRFSAAARERAPGDRLSTVRARLGIGADEHLVLFPIGAWALQMCRDYLVPFYEHLPRLLVRYLHGFPGRVRLLFLSSGLGDRRESHGRLELDFRSSLPFDVVEDLTRAAHLVLADNRISSSVGRAVMAGVPAATLVSSLRVERDGHSPAFASGFNLSPGVREALTDLEARAPGSVFPFWAYPMGWREELAPLLEDNLYGSTHETLELFDEGGTSSALHALLGDGGRRSALMARQAEYRGAVEALPGAAVIADAILARAEARTCP